MILYEENDDRFYIKESTLKGAGKGVFAKRNISKDEYLHISGVMVKRNSIADECTYFFNSYKFAARVKYQGDLVDIGENLIIPLGFTAIINHIDDARQSVQIRYVGDQYPTSNPHTGKAVYWFIRDVEKDEEIFGNYGEKWNDVLKWVNEMNSKSELKTPLLQEFMNLNLYELKKIIE